MIVIVESRGGHFFSRDWSSDGDCEKLKHELAVAESLCVELLNEKIRSLGGAQTVAVLYGLIAKPPGSHNNIDQSQAPLWEN